MERLRNYKLRLETAKFAGGANDALLEATDDTSKAFEEALDDDLNTAEALGVIFEYVRVTNTAMDSGTFLAGNVQPALELLGRFDTVFDVLRPTVAAAALADAQIESLIAERTASKKSRNFQRADQIRNELLEQGVILEDTKDGVRWKRK